MSTLTPNEVKLVHIEFNKLLKQKQEFVKQYGNQAEKVMYGKCINIVKKQNVHPQKPNI